MKIIEIDLEKREVLYLGYELKLTKTEFDVLYAISRQKSPQRSKDLFNEVYENKDITLGNIAVYVCRINKKAKEIGGRVLILSSRGGGYRLNQEL